MVLDAFPDQFRDAPIASLFRLPKCKVIEWKADDDIEEEWPLNLVWKLNDAPGTGEGKFAIIA